MVLISIRKGESKLVGTGCSGSLGSLRATDFFSCNNCENRKLCTACPAVFAAVSGDPEQVDPFYCRYAEKRRDNIYALTGLNAMAEIKISAPI